MKLRWMTVLGLMMVTAAVQAATLPDELPIKDADGKTYAVVVLCNDCESPEGAKPCDTGAEDGWLNGKPCGQCLLMDNYGQPMLYPYDLHFTGTLTDAAGHPIKDRFVKMYLANGWKVRTRTTEQGTFRLMLGATAERKSNTPLVTDIGVRVDSVKGSDPNYAIFLMPPSYKPCSAAAASTPAAKQAGKQNGKKPGGKKH
jgi:hypothetical protein